MRLTDAHVQFWLQHRGPTWMNAVPKPKSRVADLSAQQLIHRCVNAHAGQIPTRSETYASQLCSWAKSWQQRIGKYPAWSSLSVLDLASEFQLLAESPYAHQAPRRSAYARKWYYRLRGMKPPRVRR